MSPSSISRGMAGAAVVVVVVVVVVGVVVVVVEPKNTFISN